MTVINFWKAKLERILGPAISFVIRHYLVILVTGFVFGLAGIAYAWLTPPKYIARLTFSIDEDNPISSNLGGLAASFGIDLGTPGGVFTGDNILELVRSRKMIERALLSPTTNNGKQMTLVDYYLQLKPLAKNEKKIGFPLNADRGSFSRQQDSVLGAIYKRISEGDLYVGKIDKKLSIMEVTFTGADEKFSKEFTQRLMLEVSNFYTETKTKRSRRNVELLQAKADSIHDALNRALYGRAASVDANLNPSRQAPLVSAQRSQTDATVLTAAYGEILKNLEVSKYTLLRETPLIQVIDEPIYPLKKKKPGRLMSGIVGGMLGVAIATLLLYVYFFLANIAVAKPNQRVEI